MSWFASPSFLTVNAIKNLINHSTTPRLVFVIKEALLHSEASIHLPLDYAFPFFIIFHKANDSSTKKSR